MPSEKIRPLKKSDFETLAEFRHALRQFIAFSEAAAAGHGLTPQQHQALLAIEGYPGRSAVTVGELAGRLDLAPHSAVGLVDRMEKSGLIRRQTSRRDRRKVCVLVTATGRRLLARLGAAHRAELRNCAPRLIRLLRRAALPAGAAG